MQDSFEIPVLYNDTEINFPARLIQQGYVHKFLLDVYGQEVFFEQDDNGRYRAIVDIHSFNEANKPDKELLRAIAESIEAILK